MKKVFIFMAIALSFCKFNRMQAQVEEIIPKVGGEDEIFIVCETPAEFPGGKKELYKFISSNFEYPKKARENGISGTVHTTFVVEKDGSLSDIKVLHDIGYGCGEEIVRIIKLMPKWNPAKQKGEAVRMQFNLPFKFSLPKK